MLVKSRYRHSKMTVSHSGKMGFLLSSFVSGHLGLYGSVPLGLHWSMLKLTPAREHGVTLLRPNLAVSQGANCAL